MRKMKTLERPTREQLAAEVKRLRCRSRYHSVLRSTVCTLIVVASAAVLVATVWMPVLQIYGSSMTPTLNEGDIVVSVKGSRFRQGELAAFYVGNKILVKRCIALPGQIVDMDAEGSIYVDGKLLEEPYLFRRTGTSAWATIAPHRWTPGIRRSDVSPKNSLWEKSYSVSGRCRTSAH